MSDFPEPLTPADCDLQDFAFMPLDVDRLRDSDLASDETPEACWAAVLLWCASWHQVPAGSIPDNENWIAKQAGYASRGKIDKEWPRVRPGALRHWVKCSDGRLYHPVVALKAKEAWQAKLRQRWTTECSRIKKHNQRHGTDIPTLDFETWNSSGRPQGHPLYVPEDNDESGKDRRGDKLSKRQREGQGQGNNGSVPKGTGGEPPQISEEEAKKLTKDELWSVGKSILVESGMPAKQCGSFVGKLCKDYGDDIVIEAVRAAVVTRPADPVSFLKASCMARKGEGGKSLIPWHATDAGVIAKGKEFDPPLTPNRGEKMVDFKARVIAAIEKRDNPPAAAATSTPAPSPTPPQPSDAAAQIPSDQRQFKPDGVGPLKDLVKGKA